MDRAEVIRMLRETYEKGGLSALSEVCDEIRANGQLHDPDWVTCVGCGAEFEQVPRLGYNLSKSLSERCTTCRVEHHAALQRSYERDRRPWHRWYG